LGFLHLWSIALLYIERWLKAPVQMEDGSVVPQCRSDYARQA
jgi:hypothetical protein